MKGGIQTITIVFLSIFILPGCDNAAFTEDPAEISGITHVRQIGKNKLRVYYVTSPYPLLIESVADASDSAWTDYIVTDSYHSEINGKKILVVTVSPDLVVNDKLIIGIPPFTPDRVCYLYIWPWDDEGPL